MKVSALIYSMLFAVTADGFTSVPTSFVSRSSPLQTMTSNVAHRAASVGSDTDGKKDQPSTTPADPVMASTSMDVDSESASTESSEPSLSPAEIWALQLETQEVQEVRAELVQKYLSLGRTQEYAEREVDEFLSDPERSQQFLEMRRYANAQAEELMGFEIWVQLFGAFALGLGGQFAIKYYNAYRAVYPHGEGPLPWLP